MRQILFILLVTTTVGCGKPSSNDVRSLDLSHTRKLRQVAGDPKLAMLVRRVYFTDTSFGDAMGSDFQRIAALPNLEEVTAYGTTNTDRLIPALSSCKSLRSVTFCETDLTDAGFLQIQAPVLERVSIDIDNGSISSGAIEAARARLPACVIAVYSNGKEVAGSNRSNQPEAP